MSGAVTGFRLTGAGAAAALEALHALAELHGVWEHDDGVTVWVRGALPDLRPFAVGVTRLPDDAGVAQTGLEQDQPVLVCGDLLVRPPWVQAPRGFRGVELVLPRGYAFGSGEHGSTRAALHCLHAAWSPGIASCADIGCGSGILLLYAAVRGVGRLFGCDIDPFAVRASVELLPQATVTAGGPATVAERCDCVVANMTGAELGACLPVILGRWNGRGPLVLSGMRATEVDAILARLPAVPHWRAEVDGFHGVALAGKA